MNKHAFPVPGFPSDPNYSLPETGMTLRQWYAGLALAGGLIGDSRIFMTEDPSMDAHAINSAIAMTAVRLADALIAELEKEER